MSEQLNNDQKTIGEPLKSTRKKPSLISLGSAVKAGKDGIVSGLLVRFTGPNEKDRDQQYFDKNTDFYTLEDAKPIIWYHGWSGTKADPVGFGKITKTDKGLEITGKLDLANPTASKIFEKAQKNQLGWSSDSSQHLIEIESDGRIKRWPLVAASLAPATTVRDPKAKVFASVMPTKAFRKACKAGQFLVEASDLNKLDFLRKAFAQIIRRIDLVRPFMSERPVQLAEVSNEYSLSWKLDGWERELQEATKAGREISAKNREKINKSVLAIADEIQQLKNLLDETNVDEKTDEANELTEVKTEVVEVKINNDATKASVSSEADDDLVDLLSLVLEITK